MEIKRIDVLEYLHSVLEGQTFTLSSRSNQPSYAQKQPQQKTSRQNCGRFRIELSAIITRVAELEQNGTAYFNSTDPIRVVFSSADTTELQGQIARLLETLEKGRNPGTLAGRGIFYVDQAIGTSPRLPEHSCLLDKAASI